MLDGTSIKVNYESNYPMDHATDVTTKGGDFQDLIMWDQLTDFARKALNETSFGDANVPMNDGNFVSSGFLLPSTSLPGGGAYVE
ncbi:hypothetical protein PF011_g26356 [Phytophthora fragariae]|uniref:Uncharacterized protein n=1 Tax=Phytophthora fragariae TaxID=53985 RepID=A0A6A3HMN2_9STRA|nr:hypothetical protein PF011_g26356 [Phytophthora fragariae]